MLPAGSGALGSAGTRAWSAPPEPREASPQRHVPLHPFCGEEKSDPYVPGAWPVAVGGGGPDWVSTACQRCLQQPLNQVAPLLKAIVTGADTCLNSQDIRVPENMVSRAATDRHPHSPLVSHFVWCSGGRGPHGFSPVCPSPACRTAAFLIPGPKERGGAWMLSGAVATHLGQVADGACTAWGQPVWPGPNGGVHSELCEYLFLNLSCFSKVPEPVAFAIGSYGLKYRQ